MSSMEWPRGAVFDNRASGGFAFLIYRESQDSPIEVKYPISKPEPKRTVVATVHDLSLFCQLFGLDYPEPLEEAQDHE